jgi:hypothetical protein
MSKEEKILKLMGLYVLLCLCVWKGIDIFVIKMSLLDFIIILIIIIFTHLTFNWLKSIFNLTHKKQ